LLFSCLVLITAELAELIAGHKHYLFLSEALIIGLLAKPHIPKLQLFKYGSDLAI